MSDRTDLTDRPWLDAAASTHDRVEALLAAMTLQEKAGQLVQVANPDPVRDATALADGAFGTAIVASGEHAGNVRDAGTQAGQVDALQRVALSGRLGIPLVVARDVIHGHRTVFPIPLGQAASFDADLVRAAARVAAREATADGVRWTFAPMLDVTRDPRWGRVAEGYGESAWLTGHLGAAAVQGFQGDDLSDPESLAACAKHFVGYGLATGGRDYAEVDLGPRTLHDVYLRPFRDAVDAGVATVMSAFHTLDGVPMTAHAGLLREHLKGDLGFDGVVVSDWDAVGELLHHGVTADLPGAATLALGAGVDVDMVTQAYRHLPDLVRAGRVEEKTVDDAVRRVLALKVRLGLFERPFTGPGRAEAVHLAPAHRALARAAAARACVLLRDDGVLPLAHGGSARGQSIHVTGPFATARAELFGTWTLDGRGEDAVSIAEALTERLDGVDGARVGVDDGRWIEESLVAARAADVVVACVGEHPMRSGEANSVTSIDLPPGQVEQLEALARVSRRLVVVVVTGRPLATDRLAGLGDALLLAFHPGVEGGHGIADVLVGDVPASGRLPMSLPRTVGQVPVFHDHRPTGRPLAVDGPVGRYRDHQDTPAYPFGFGLGHSPVEYGPVRLSGGRLGPGEAVTATARVTNAGTHPVLETAQLYVRAHLGRVSRPVAELVGVRHVELAPGTSADVSFTLDQSLLTHRDPCGAAVLDPGPFTVAIAPHAGAATSTTGAAALLDVGPVPEGQS